MTSMEDGGAVEEKVEETKEEVELKPSGSFENDSNLFFSVMNESCVLSSFFAICFSIYCGALGFPSNVLCFFANKEASRVSCCVVTDLYLTCVGVVWVSVVGVVLEVVVT